MLTEFYSSRNAAEPDRLMGRHEGGWHRRLVTSVPDARANSGVTLHGRAVWLLPGYPASAGPRDQLRRRSLSTSKVRAPTSCGIGASHGEARSVARASDTPCAQRDFIVVRLNS